MLSKVNARLFFRQATHYGVSVAYPDSSQYASQPRVGATVVPRLTKDFVQPFKIVFPFARNKAIIVNLTNRLSHSLNKFASIVVAKLSSNVLEASIYFALDLD